MHRNNLLELLRQYNPSAQEEIQYKKDILAFIQTYKDCFERSLEVGHITASAWLVNKDNTKALLMHHAKLNMWCQLGGHCDGDSDALAVAVKEAQEESGINNIAPVSGQIFDIDIHLIPANKREKEHYHYDIRFLLQVIGDEQVVKNNESKALSWFTKDCGALPTNELSVTRMFVKWLKIAI